MIHVLNLVADKMAVPFIEIGKSEEELVSGIDMNVALEVEIST